MYSQEVKNTDIRGGILADEMGMGKTLQTIVTILDNRPKLQWSLPGAKFPPSVTMDDRRALSVEEEAWDKCVMDWKHEMRMNDIPKSLYQAVGGKGRQKNNDGSPPRAGTLVVCPVIALSQWKSEIEKFSSNGALSVKIYHGPDRSKETPRELMVKYDVILTTYQVLEADFRKMISPNRVKCPNCGGKFKVRRKRCFHI